MLVTNGPFTIFKIILLVSSFIFNITAFRCHPCNCGKRRCAILPLFLAGNILTLIFHISDILPAFGVYFPLEKGNCSFTFVASNLLCTYFVALGVLRRVLSNPNSNSDSFSNSFSNSNSDLQSYRFFFFGCLIFSPLLSAGIQAMFVKTAVEESLVLHVRVPISQGPQKEMLIPLASCAKNICGSGDVVLTVLSSLVPSLVPIISLAVCILVSYSARKRMREKMGSKDSAATFSPLIPEYCDREQNCWPILKFVLVLFMAWTVFAKPLTIFLTHLTRLYAGSSFGLDEASVFVCSNFWDFGNHIILFTAATLTPLVFICSYKPFCRKKENFSPNRKSLISFVDRPVTVMGSISEIEIGNFSWDTFAFAPSSEKKLLTGNLDENRKSFA